MIGCSTKDILIDKSFQDWTTPLLTPPLLLPLDLPNHDLYPFHHVCLKPLPFAFAHHRLSLKHDDINGDGNSSKKNSLKNHLKELAKIPSSSSGPASKIESMIQLPSRGVMLRFPPFHLPDTHIIYLCLPSPSYSSHHTLLFPFLLVSYAALLYSLTLVSSMRCVRATGSWT